MITKKTFKKYCDYAIDNILHEGTTDVELFNRPFEIDYLKQEKFRDKIKDSVYGAVMEVIEQSKFESLKIHKIGYVLVPKKSLSDFRKCAWIDIYDEIIYLTIVLAMAPHIEKARIPKTENRVFSYRYISDENTLFDKNYNYTKFRETVELKSNCAKNNVLVECDISNYYDRINLHRIESILRSIPRVEEDLIRLLNDILLFWSDRDSYGIPVGSNASRILAEAALIEVDNYLISKNIDFCRYVDDYRIFAKDAFEAHSNLAILNHRLSKEGLFLNTQKTNIKDISLKKKRVTVTNSGQSNNKESGPQKEVNTEEKEEQLNKPKIIRGYSGLIPTKFRQLSAMETAKLEKIDLDLIIEESKETILIEPKEVTTIVRAIIAQEKFEKFLELPGVLKKFPQFIPYFVDVLLKFSNQLTEKELELLQESFKEWMVNPDTPEYIQVYLIRLYASSPFQNKEVLLNMFRELKRNSGDYVGRALLEALDNLLTRGELLEIKEYYYRADRWERRQILSLINKGLSAGEKRPFFKDVKIHMDDLFVSPILI